MPAARPSSPAPSPFEDRLGYPLMLNRFPRSWNWSASTAATFTDGSAAKALPAAEYSGARAYKEGEEGEETMEE